MLAPLLLFALPSLAGEAGVHYQVDLRGIPTQLEVGSCLFLSEAAVSLIGPGWRGNLGDQRTLDLTAIEVSRTPGWAVTKYGNAISSTSAENRQGMLPPALGHRVSVPTGARPPAGPLIAAQRKIEHTPMPEGPLCVQW